LGATAAKTVRRVFLHQATHADPERLPPPAALAEAYRREAREVTAVAGLEELFENHPSKVKK